jgi:DNA-directed RNA polymerase specialized sigma24 family protein
MRRNVQRRALPRHKEGVDSETRFRAVFDVGYAALCRYARHRGLTGPDAEDLVAQTLEIAWRRIDDVPAAEPLPWLYTVAHNLWRNQTRRDRRRRELLARFRRRGGPRPARIRPALNLACRVRGAEITDVEYATRTWSRQKSSSVLLAGNLSPSLAG